MMETFEDGLTRGIGTFDELVESLNHLLQRRRQRNWTQRLSERGGEGGFGEVEDANAFPLREIDVHTLLSQ